MHLVLQHSIVYFLQQYSSKSTIATIIALSKTRKPLNTFCLKAAPWPTNTPACQPGNCIAQAGIRTIRKTGSLTQLSIHDYQQDTNTRHQYAWNPDGSSASYDKDGTTATPQITRDASGLPVKVGNKTIEFDNDSKHYHPDLGKHVRENVKQLISLIPVNIPWISLPKP